MSKLPIVLMFYVKIKVGTEESVFCLFSKISGASLFEAGWCSLLRWLHGPHSHSNHSSCKMKILEFVGEGTRRLFFVVFVIFG